MYSTFAPDPFFSHSATSSEVRIYKSQAERSSNCTMSFTYTYNPGNHITFNESFLKQEIKKLQKELLMHPSRTDIKIKIMEYQKELRKFGSKKKKK